MAKSLVMEPDVRAYLACVLADAMVWCCETLRIPDCLPVELLTAAEWARYRLESAGASYEAYGI